MRRLKGIKPSNKPLTKEQEEKVYARLEFLSNLTQEERKEYAASKFEKETGLKDGARVRFIGKSDGPPTFWGTNPSVPRGILNSETIYEIEHITIGRSWTVVKLVGFREEEFSGGIFEPVNKDDEKKQLKVGDQLRYIASEKYAKGHSNFYGYSDPHGVLDFEGVYEVKSVEKNSGFTGLLGVEFVGFKGRIFNRVLFERV